MCSHVYVCVLVLTFLVLNYDNPVTRQFAKEAKGEVIFFSDQERLDNGYIVDEGTIKFCENNLRKHILNVKDVFLRGVHNYENIFEIRPVWGKFFPPVRFWITQKT